MISVTITGADDAVDPCDMAALSAEFPFLEWGILLSEKRQGTPRYPMMTAAWAGELLALSERCQLSAHLCGELARNTAHGRWPAWLPAVFQRCQINGYDASYCHGAIDLSIDYPIELILQCRSVDALQSCANDSHLMVSGSVLFDPSGGKGVEPFAWPVAPLGTKIGFAGGIGPENVEQVISEIVAGSPWLSDLWVDMESGVRTDDRFDLGKVRQVIEKVAAINRRMA